MVTDTVGDAIARINNALLRNRDAVVLPKSKILTEILEVMKANNFIGEYKNVEEGINVELVGEKVTRITSIKRVSKPGLRIYKGYKNFEKVINGYGISIVTTSKGIMSNKDARKQKTGGEVILKVY